MSTTKVTTGQMRDFALTLEGQCKDHAAWLAFVRYGLGFLLDNQPLLIELITREASRLTDRAGLKGSMCVETQRIFEELGLQLVVALPAGAGRG